MERITGPIRGWHIAAYAVPVDTGFVGYAKLCREAPEDVWGCDAVRKVAGDLHDTLETALLNAEYHARNLIDVIDELRRFSAASVDWRMIRQMADRRMGGDWTRPVASAARKDPS